MDAILSELTATATLAIALFSIGFCLLQRRFVWVYRCFALFLLAVAFSNLPVAIQRVLDSYGVPDVHPILMGSGIAVSLCIAPLLWLYVYVLTSETPHRPKRLWLHLILPGLAVALAVALAFVPAADFVALLEEPATEDVNIPIAFLLLAVVGLFMLLLPQNGVYILLILRRMLRYRSRLRDVYASTERHEITWIVVLAVLMLGFWCAASVGLIIAFRTEAENFPAIDISALALFATIALWGLRQRPGLVPPTSDDTGPKYEKSALTTDAATRIERKLRSAMTEGYLHRDANLSLWDLAQHVGASPNYVSQTLNDAMGQSFFDFVNGYRIAEAQHRLTETDDTVLAITYDVGFNSRSSFYTAFRKVTGQTPSTYRKSPNRPPVPDQAFMLSERAGSGETGLRPS